MNTMLKFSIAVSLIFPFCAAAQNWPFHSALCADADPNAKAPIFVEIHPEGPFNEMRFNLGNLLGIDHAHRDYSVYGVPQLTSSTEGTLAIQGSFNSFVAIRVNDGKSLVSGPLKYDPTTGQFYPGNFLVREYPLDCILK